MTYDYLKNLQDNLPAENIEYYFDLFIHPEISLTSNIDELKNSIKNINISFYTEEKQWTDKFNENYIPDCIWINKNELYFAIDIGKRFFNNLKNKNFEFGEKELKNLVDQMIKLKI